MSFDRFKEIKPKALPQPEGTDSYFEMLDSLEHDKPKSKTLSVVFTVAAAVIIVALVSVWALIGRGIRGQDIVVPADKYENVELKRQEITPTLIHELGRLLQDNRIEFFPLFDKENPLTLEMLIYVCEQTHYDLFDDLVLTKEEFENFTYDTFGYKVKLKKDIKYDKAPSYIVCMEYEGYTIMSYRTSEVLDDGLKVAEIELQFSKTVRKVRWVLNSQNELEYVISIVHEDKNYPTPKRDQSITNEMRATYFDFVIDYRVDAMPQFSEGELPDSKKMKLYATHLHTDYLEKNNSQIENEIVLQTAKDMFGIESILDEDMEYTVGWQDLNEYPYAELIQYNKEQTENGTVITATVGIDRAYDQYGIVWKDSFESSRNKIIEGNKYKPYFYRICVFKYIAKDDGVTPERFIEVKHINNSQDEFWAYFE